MFEFENFSKGTKAVMDAVVHATENGAITIIGKFFMLYNEITLNPLACQSQLLSSALL